MEAIVDPSQPSSAATSSNFLLDDHQFRVGEKTVERYYHHVQRVESSAGLQDLSQLRFYFEPTYQRLVIHFVRIRRGGETINALQPAEVKIIQQEEELDQQLYNGTLAALIFLNDLRVGDIVDSAYTISGENPVLGGQYAETIYLADQLPIDRLSVRLLWPSKRALAIKNENIDLQPAIQNLGAESEYSWERTNVSAIDVEDSTPGWFNPYPSVSLSEFQSWGDVVHWAMPMYKVGPLDSPALSAQVKKWESSFATSAERTLAALRFVQDEIRYLGIELGRYSHQPSSPQSVFQRRFGDCKDKSLLLSSILHSMGIDAAPALVDSTAGRLLDARQPSPFAFDHVIVRVRLDGKNYWLDATGSYEGGRLNQYYDPPYERALVLREGNGALESIPLPLPTAGSTTVQEVYKGATVDAPVALSVTTTYRGSNADSMRYSIANSSLAELSKQYLNYYANANQSISADGLPHVSDDRENNLLIVIERYQIAGFWKDAKHRFLAEGINRELAKPNISQRSMPLRIRHPVSIDYTVSIDLGEPFSITAETGNIVNEVVKFDYAYSTSGNLITLKYNYRTFADHVPVEKVAQHLLLIDRMSGYVGYELTNGGSGVGPGRRSRGTFTWPAILVLIAFAGGLGYLAVQRSRRSRTRAKSEFVPTSISKPGASPETAINVQGDEELERVLSRFECSCGQHPYSSAAAPPRERFTYDGARLIGVQLPCTCGMKNDLYLRSLADQAMA